MTWAEIEKALLRHPPAYENTDARKRARAAAWVPDVLFPDGMHDSGRSVRATYPDLFRIPVHDHEMKHTGGGNKLAPWFNDRSVFERKRRMVLMWGESFLVTRQLLSQRSGE